MTAKNPLFERIEKGAALILFSGERCAPCDALKPLLYAEVARRPGLNILTLKPSDDSAMELYRRYSVRSSPTVIYFHNGVELNRFSGFRDPQALAEILNRWNLS